MKNFDQYLDRLLEVTVVGSFSRLGYSARSRLFHWEHDGSLTGRRVLVSGATSGIGLATAHELARRGASVILLVRDRQRGESLLVSLSGTGHSVVVADLSNLADAVSASDEIVRGGKIDVVIHNAGALNVVRQRSAQGYEATLASQLLSPAVITQRLMSSQRSVPSRIITVTSGGMYGAKFNLDLLRNDPEPYDGVRRYALVKRAQVVWSMAMADRAPEAFFASTQPGWVRTPGLQRSLPKFDKWLGPLLRSPDQGADTIVWLASDSKAIDESGRLWHDRRPRSLHRLSRTRSDDERDGRELLSWLSEELSPYFS